MRSVWPGPPHAKPHWSPDKDHSGVGTQHGRIYDYLQQATHEKNWELIPEETGESFFFFFDEQIHSILFVTALWIIQDTEKRQNPSKRVDINF